MSVHCIKAVQTIPIGLEATWDFFSRPDNLQAITPAYMRFQITSTYRPERMYPGQIIEYKVCPLLGIPLYWMTEITHVVEGKLFVDEQRFGPYSLWHHQHHFREVPGGTEMIDVVHYKLPLWVLGDLAHVLFVKKQLADIFEYRRKKVAEMFGTFPPL